MSHSFIYTFHSSVHCKDVSHNFISFPIELQIASQASLTGWWFSTPPGCFDVWPQVSLSTSTEETVTHWQQEAECESFHGRLPPPTSAPRENQSLGRGVGGGGHGGRGGCRVRLRRLETPSFTLRQREPPPCEYIQLMSPEPSEAEMTSRLTPG